MAHEYDLATVKAAVEESPYDWVAGETPLTRLSERERKLRLGVAMPSESDLARMARDGAAVSEAALRVSRDNTTLPTAFNLHDVDGRSYVAGVRDQGACGSCVAFGSVGVLEGTARWMRRTPGLPVDLSEAHLYYGWGGTVGTGWLPLPALTFCTDRGITVEAKWPYSPGNSNGAELSEDWEAHRAKSTGLVDLTGNVADMKRHLNDYGPIAGCFLVHDDFFAYRGGVYRPVSETYSGGHCVAIVGYDDSRQAWICKNSWGLDWGDSGFFWIGYGECGMETWQVIGVRSVALRMWTGRMKVGGLFASGDERGAWVYLSDANWMRVGGVTTSQHLAMLSQLIASKQADRWVNSYTNDGVLDALYAF